MRSRSDAARSSPPARLEQNRGGPSVSRRGSKKAPPPHPVATFEPEAPFVPKVSWIADTNVDAEAPANDRVLFDERHRLNGPILWTRHATFAALLAAISFLHEFAPHRVILTIALVMLLLPFGVWVHTTAQTEGRIPLSTPWVDGLASVVMVAVAPNLLRYAIVLAIGQLIMGVLAYGAMAAFMSSMVLVIGYPIVIMLVGTPLTLHDLDTPVLAMFALFVPGVAFVSHRLRLTEESTRRKYLDLLSGLEAVVWEADPETLELTYVSAQIKGMLGYEPEAFKKNWTSYIHADDRDREAASRKGAVKMGETSFVLDHRMVTRKGETIFVLNTFAVERNSDGVPLRVRGVLVDATRQKEAENTIRKQAQYDALTGLPNRSLFTDQLRKSIDDARRTSEGLAVLLLDLNGFKEVNDTLGHSVGDQLLQAIAGRLVAYLPERSLVARLGGDEFCVMLFPATTRTAAKAAETITGCLRSPITVDDMTIQASVAIGIAMYPADGDIPSSLLRQADGAMYESKQSGHSHVFATQDEQQDNSRRLQLLGELRASISSGDFRLFHQPKIDLGSGLVVGTEGLARWDHRQFGLLPPSEFIELSELSGLIQPLTRWVIAQGIEDLASFRSQGLELTVALNLSVRSFFDQGLPSFIAQLLSAHNVPADQLILEVSERDVMIDRALSRAALSAFRSLGVKISVDDFGTGFSSLPQLQQLPLDELKIDQSFIAGVLTNPQDKTIVRAITDLGHNLGLEVVAEGVEHAEQRELLKALGLDRAQGFEIAKPMPKREFLSWLRTVQHGVVVETRPVIAELRKPATPAAEGLRAPSVLRGLAAATKPSQTNGDRGHVATEPAPVVSLDLSATPRSLNGDEDDLRVSAVPFAPDSSAPEPDWKALLREP